MHGAPLLTQRRMPVKNLAELQSECAALGISVNSSGRKDKRPWIQALQEFHWRKEHPGSPLPPQIQPMLLADWKDLDPDSAREIEKDDGGWVVQPKLDGVRALLHVEGGAVRITGRQFSEVTYRLAEFQGNLPHLTEELEVIDDTILDGELVCPSDTVNTGATTTGTALQAATAILATRPENAQRIQEEQDARLRFHVFDVLTHFGEDITTCTLRTRLEVLKDIVAEVENPYVELVPTCAADKVAFHDAIIAQGGEGTVWKRLDKPYEPGRRVAHWIKRKRSLQVEAVVSAFKPGNANRGNGHLVGAIEFSVPNGNGTVRPIAWVSNLTDDERRAMTRYDGEGGVTLNPEFLGRRAVLSGQDQSVKSRRIRHARIVKWLG